MELPDWLCKVDLVILKGINEQKTTKQTTMKTVPYESGKGKGGRGQGNGGGWPSGTGNPSGGGRSNGVK